MAPAIARADPAGDTAAAMRAADQAFEARVQVVGPARAFRDYMDPADGLEFGSGAPTRGAEAIYQSMGGARQPRVKLMWVVADAWGAASGDFGVTTGAWELTPLAQPAPTVTGRYVTVWREDAAGHDLGEADDAAVAVIERAPRGVAARQYGEASRTEQRLVGRVEWAVDEDRPRPCRLRPYERRHRRSFRPPPLRLA